MRDFQAQVQQGREIIEKHPRADMKASEYKAIREIYDTLINEGDKNAFLNVIHTAYLMGLSAGARVERGKK